MSTRPPRKPNTTYSAPIGSVDLAAEMDDGTPYPIWPCQSCLPWHAEAILDDSGQVFVREWHAVDCEEYQVVLRAAQGAEPEDQSPA